MDSKESFLSWYDDQADALFRFCLSRTGSVDVAHDLTQDTFMRLWDALQQKGSIDYPRALMYRIARNAIIDWYRKHKAESLDTLQADGFEPVDTARVPGLEQATHNHALVVLQTLPDQYREILMLRYVEDLPPREIADIIGESTNVVSVRLNRAMKALQESLGTTQYA